MRVLKIKVLEVNGYDVCGKDENEIMFYLNDIPDESIETFRRKGSYYVIAMGNEFVKEGCKELRHMKLNQLFNSKEEAEIYLTNHTVPKNNTRRANTFYGRHFSVV